MDKVNVNISDEEPQTVETTYVCICGRVMTTLDDFDTLGSDSGICCPDCGNEEFQSIAELKTELGIFKQEIQAFLDAMGDDHTVVGQLAIAASKESRWEEWFKNGTLPEQASAASERNGG